jgi:hypothetical protein
MEQAKPIWCALCKTEFPGGDFYGPACPRCGGFWSPHQISKPKHPDDETPGAKVLTTSDRKISPMIRILSLAAMAIFALIYWRWDNMRHAERVAKATEAAEQRHDLSADNQHFAYGKRAGAAIAQTAFISNSRIPAKYELEKIAEEFWEHPPARLYINKPETDLLNGHLKAIFVNGFCEGYAEYYKQYERAF